MQEKSAFFSKISGVVTLDGKPAANAKITRTVNLNKDKVDYTYTDEKGYFEMPAVFQRTVTKFLPQEFVAKQDIVVQYDGNSYDIWSGVKRTPEENAEARGKTLNVQCELNSEKSFKQVNNSPYISRCTWPTEPDEIDTGF
ncbi:MAG: transthyretin-like family protein [Cellvibrionaceae bacterium]|nr:transthyretin-like family protein [Cellvibrionaceae bacterium]